jgi:dTDP-4-dehydrorhamnose 3,5-epimerase-like enzyme
MYVRGEHAHRTCQQFLVCVKVTVAVMVDNGHSREEFLLDRPTIGIFVPPRVWCVQYNYSADAVLMVFASQEYDPADYIRDYDEFLNLAAADASMKTSQTESQLHNRGPLPKP